MKRNYSVLTLVFSSVLLLQLGCQEQVKVAEKPTPAASLLRSKTAGAPDAAVVSPPQKAKAAPRPDKSSPKITFEKVVYDFGQIGPSTKHYGEFKFTNTGEGLLKIKDVERCCGVNAKLDKTKYAPGESGVLKVEYDSTRSPGIVRRTLYVNSNDKATPRTALTIKGNIIQKVIWQPKSLRLLLSEENAGCSEIILSSVDNRPFSITAFKSTLGCITADVDPSVEATKFVLQPKVDMDKLRKTMRGNVYISMSHPDCDGAAIGFDVLSRFKIKPPLLIVFYLDSQKSIKSVIERGFHKGCESEEDSHQLSAWAGNYAAGCQGQEEIYGRVFYKYKRRRKAENCLSGNLFRKGTKNTKNTIKGIVRPWGETVRFFQVPIRSWSRRTEDGTRRNTFFGTG